MRKVAIISGGAGDLGRAVSARLASSGYSIVIADVNAAAADRVLETLATDQGQVHQRLIGDLTQLETAKRVVALAREAGTISAMVNAVGISPKAAGEKINFYDISPELWDDVMAINLKAPFLLIQQAYAHMPTDGSASIVNLLSITSKVGGGGLSQDDFYPKLPSTAAYAASKAALQNLTATLAHELSSFNIRVNGVAPGLIRTQMTSQSLDKHDVSTQIPMKRFGTIDEVIDGIEFLLSDKSSYISGQSLDINGAWATC